MNDTRATVSIRETNTGFISQEAEHRFAKERALHHMFHAVAAALVLGAGALWLRPSLGVPVPVAVPEALGAPDLVSGMGPATQVIWAMLAASVLLVLLASRGVRRGIVVDLARQQMRFDLLSTRNRTRRKQVVALKDIDSIVINRSDSNGRLPELRVRLRGSADQQVILRGARAELEELNLRLCTDLSVAQMAQQFASDPDVMRAPVKRPRRVHKIPTGLGGKQAPARPASGSG